MLRGGLMTGDFILRCFVYLMVNMFLSVTVLVLGTKILNQLTVLLLGILRR